MPGGRGRRLAPRSLWRADFFATTDYKSGEPAEYLRTNVSVKDTGRGGRFDG